MPALLFTAVVSRDMFEWLSCEAAWRVFGGAFKVLAVLIALVGGLGLMGTKGMNVLERRRELGPP